MATNKTLTILTPEPSKNQIVFGDVAVAELPGGAVLRPGDRLRREVHAVALDAEVRARPGEEVAAP